MNYTNIFVIVLSCLLFAQFLSVSAEEIKVDSRFDPGSASLARTWQDLKGSFPHEKIPDDSETIKHPDDWAMDYGVGLVKIVGLGFVIAILSILAGIIYGIFKLIRMCCCSKKDEDDDEDEEEEDKYTYGQKWGPTLGYFICFVFLLTGMIFGLANNPRFSDGVNDMGNSVTSVGVDAIGLANGLINSVDGIVVLIPQTITTIENQFAGVPALSAEVDDLSVDINATSSQVSNITAEIQNINLRNASSSLDGIKSELNSINNSSGQIISQMASLTDQISGNLLSTLTNTLSSLSEKTKDIDETVAELKSTSDDIKAQAQDLVDKVTDTVDDMKGYDKSRGTAVTVLFVLVIIVSFVIILGFILRQKFIFNIISAIFFVFLFLLWLSGSIHFLLGMVLYDACPVIDVTVKGLLPKDSQGAVVLEGCLYEHRSVLDSLNITAYNLTDVFNFKDEFNDFASFSKNYNFSAIDDYFNNIKNLYTYNLTQVADNLTVQSMGWNETKVYDALDALNTAAAPQFQYDLTNYTLANGNLYAPPRSSVDERKAVLNETVVFNRTIYEDVKTAKTQLYDAQDDINVLVANMSSLQSRFNDIKLSVNQLETKNISNCNAALDYLQANITGFFDLGNCSFLGETYTEITVSLCQTMQPSIDLLTVAQFLAGLALIPMVIIAEMLSFRIPKASSINPFNRGESSDDSYDEEKGTKMKNIAMTTEKPLDSSAKRNSHGPGISATISAEPPATSSANSSPDFSGRRRTVAEHFNAQMPPLNEN